MDQTENLVRYLDVPDIASNPELDIRKFSPAVTVDDAYRLQFELMKKRSDRGNDIVGYQASFTSAAIQKLNPEMPAPFFGTLLRSNLKLDRSPIELDCESYAIEAEVGVLLKRDLAGPGVTRFDALRSIDGIFAAVECAAARPRGPDGRLISSPQHLIATHNTNSHIYAGPTMRPLDFDLRLEGVAISINGVHTCSAAGVEALGSPVNVVAAMANWIGGFGGSLRAGQVLITGAIPSAPRVRERGACALVEFARLGQIVVQIAK